MVLICGMIIPLKCATCGQKWIRGGGRETGIFADVFYGRPLAETSCTMRSEAEDMRSDHFRAWFRSPTVALSRLNRLQLYYHCLFCCCVIQCLRLFDMDVV